MRRITEQCPIDAMTTPANGKSRRVLAATTSGLVDEELPPGGVAIQKPEPPPDDKLVVVGRVALCRWQKAIDPARGPAASFGGVMAGGAEWHGGPVA